MTDDEIIAVVQAHKEGKKIQFRGKFELGRWSYTNYPEWQFGTTDYCVAPEPRKFPVLRLVYKGAGAWKEADSCETGKSEKVRLFQEIGESSGEPTVISSEVKTFNQTRPEPRNPREWWLILDQTLGTGTPVFRGYTSKQSYCDAEQIHVREVT